MGNPIVLGVEAYPGAGQPFDPGYWFRFAERAEGMGLDLLAVPDSVARPIPAFESLTWSAALAARTRRIKIGTHVLVAALRHPLELARRTATIDIVSQGRFTLGVGLGWRPLEYANLGMSIGDRARRTEEVVDIVKRLWTEPSVTYEGRFYRIRDAVLEPKPVQKPHPPIHFGAASSAGLRRTARMGNGLEGQIEDESGKREHGFHPRDLVERMREFAAAAGRRPDEIFISLLIRANINDDPERAIAEAKAYWDAQLGEIEGARPFDHKVKSGAYGPAERLAAKIRECADAGVHRVVLYLHSLDPMEQLVRLEKAVLPRI